MSGLPHEAPWPVLRVAEWAETRDTVHMWFQIVGKVKLALAPMVNHWWQVALRVSARGLTTSAVPYRDGCFDMEFDFLDHQLHIRTSVGPARRIALEPKSVAQFHTEIMTALRELGIEARIWAHPVEVPRAIPFAEDTEHCSYDPVATRTFWRQLVVADRVLQRFRTRFLGKVSPVLFFWGAMDVACTRFSGRPAPTHPGGVPNCADWVMIEGYSHELASTGFWPGGSEEGSFYAYTYPEPEGYARAAVEPAAAWYEAALGEYVLPFRAARTAECPEKTVLEFFQSTYAAAADIATWDRDRVEYGRAVTRTPQ